MHIIHQLIAIIFFLFPFCKYDHDLHEHIQILLSANMFSACLSAHFVLPVVHPCLIQMEIICDLNSPVINTMSVNMNMMF